MLFIAWGQVGSFKRKERDKCQWIATLKTQAMALQNTFPSLSRPFILEYDSKNREFNSSSDTWANQRLPVCGMCTSVVECGWVLDLLTFWLIYLPIFIWNWVRETFALSRHMDFNHTHIRARTQTNKIEHKQPSIRS